MVWVHRCVGYGVTFAHLIHVKLLCTFMCYFLTHDALYVQQAEQKDPSSGLYQNHVYTPVYYVTTHFVYTYIHIQTSFTLLGKNNDMMRGYPWNKKISCGLDLRTTCEHHQLTVGQPSVITRSSQQVPSQSLLLNHTFVSSMIVMMVNESMII